MPRAKLARKSTSVDMTAMTDVAFLLLTFFMLAGFFRPTEPVTVVMPSSITTHLLPDSDVLLVTVDKKGRIFFGLDGQAKRQQLINELDQQFGLGLSDKEKKNFTLTAGVGVSMKQLKSYLAMDQETRQGHPLETGIPADSANNELAIWIDYGIAAQHGNGKSLKFCIKADNETPFPSVKRVLEIFREKKLYKVNLVTNLEAEGSSDAVVARP